MSCFATLAENESAVKVMGNDSLKVIAHELGMSLKSNVTVPGATGKVPTGKVPAPI